MQLCDYAYNVLSQKKTMLKVSNKNTRKRCLLISKITLKTSERRHLTTSCLSEACIPRIYTNFQSKVCFQFCFQVRRPVISTIVDPYMSFYEKWEIISKIFHSWKFKMSVFFYFWKKALKADTFFNFLPYIQGICISITKYHKVIHLNFQ